MRSQFYVGVAVAALLLPGAAFAQSSGSIDFENDDIVVTGSRADDGVNGIVTPNTSKAKAVLTEEFIQRQTPGQTINEVINQLPGVSFQNNDPFGSSGGTLSIRGFDSSRISLTFDGIPLNDSGNYAIYSSQQLDSELIEQVNVNLGTTDVDSPTAGATGSTVNYRTRLPKENFGVHLVGSAGEFDFFRIFGAIDTGTLTSFGTRAFVAASKSTNNAPFNNISRVDKQQFNARIYQPLASNGDFLSVSGHYSESRNNFLGSVPLRTDLIVRNAITGAATDRTVGSGTANRFPITRDEDYYVIARCQTNQVARPGVADVANSCGSTFDERINPSNTGNIRVGSRFTLADGLVLNVDPSYQYVKANGGGTVVAQEGRRDVDPTPGVSNQTGYLGGTPYFGRDLNGDGDLLDTVRLLAPSQTQTHRIGVISSLRYDISDTQTIRLAYTYDRARHRQTGELNYLQNNGKPTDVFPVNDPLVDANGNVLQKRDRLSFAILHQVAGEYRGEFIDGRLVANIGVRAPFQRRNLTNNCFTSSAAGFVECFGTNTAGQAAYGTTNPTIQGPQQRVLNYSRVLPNVGATFEVAPAFSIFGNYSKGIQIPGTDNLYQSFFFAPGTPQANPTPETTDNFDAGVRYRTSKVQAQASGWYTYYKDRLASAYDAELDRIIYRNLGTVKKFGFDGSIAFQPIREVSLYAFGSYLESEIQDDVLLATVTGGANPGPRFAPTAGKREAGSPTFTFGGGGTAALGPIDLGVNAKRTGPRFIYDTNEAVRQLIDPDGSAGPLPAQTVEVYGNKTPAYWLVNLDARVKLDWAGLEDRAYFQLNVLNVFNELWVGGFNGNLTNQQFSSTTGAVSYSAPPNSQIGYPRTFMGSFVIKL